MSIPLDRLYHYIESVADDVNCGNVIIYRFLPHGSKNIADLKPLQFGTKKYQWREVMMSPHMICHDQEPLNFDFYNRTQIDSYVENRFQNSHAGNSIYYKDLVKNMNLRVAAVDPLFLHDKTLLCHSELNSSELNRYQQAGFVGVYWWNHAVLARDWFRYAEHDPALKPKFSNIEHDFLIYNRAWSGTREYRLKFAEQLIEHDLYKNCLTSFAELDNNQHYTNHVFVNTQLQILRQDLEKYFLKNTYQASSSADYNGNDYARSGIEVVLETLFDDSRHHLTEKILRTIAVGRPFVLVSTPGALKYLKSYGFKTFSGLINEDYDDIEDPLNRILFIITEMKRIAELPKKEKLKLWQQLYEIAQYNQQLFFSTAWYNTILEEFKHNFTQALATARTQINGTHWLDIRNQADHDPAIYQMKHGNHSYKTPEDQQNLLEWLSINNAC